MTHQSLCQRLLASQTNLDQIESARDANDHEQSVTAAALGDAVDEFERKSEGLRDDRVRLDSRHREETARRKDLLKELCDCPQG